MTKRVYNFGAGPAMLPLPVLQRMQEEWLDWQGLGVGVIVGVVDETSGPRYSGMYGHAAAGVFTRRRGSCWHFLALRTGSAGLSAAREIRATDGDEGTCGRREVAGRVR